MFLKRNALVAVGMILLMCVTSCEQNGRQERRIQVPVSIPSIDAEGNSVVPILTPPITLIDALEFSDGGTTYVHLKDSRQLELLICVSEPTFVEIIPADTLFLDAVHPQYADARLPMSNEEAKSVIRTLKLALETSGSFAAQAELELQGDAAEHRLFEKYGKSKSEHKSDEQWIRIYALDALKRLKAKAEFPTRDLSGSTEPDWYKAYDHDRQKYETD